MAFIPFFRFVASLIMFGLLLYVYNPIIDWLSAKYPTSGDNATVMFFLWSIIAAVFLFASGIKLLMQIQKRSY